MTPTTKGFTGSKGSVLVVGSSAKTMPLPGGRTFPIGNYLNELVVPMQALRADGWRLLVATPDGKKPPLDARSVSVNHFGGDAAAFEAARHFYENDAAFHRVVTLQSVLDQGLDDIDAIFVPGGHAPMVDLAHSPEVGKILRHAHEHAKPTALLCHGPVALLSTLSDPTAFIGALSAGQRSAASILAIGWPYAGHAMTTFSNSEEAPVEANIFGANLAYPVADALSAAGGMVSKGEVDYQCHVVVDRELITGQNPRSDHELARRLLEALNARSALRSQPAQITRAIQP